MRTMKRLSVCALVLCCGFAATGCSTKPSSDRGQQDLLIQADATLDRFRNGDPTIADRMNEARGYAVFPTIGRAGAGVGGAFGRGVVYEMDEVIGFATMTQGSFGFQLGGQTYSELILFDSEALRRFQSGSFSLGAQASAVAVTAGAAANARFENGTMVFVLGQRGLMYEATVGGQRFSFAPWERD